MVAGLDADGRVWEDRGAVLHQPYPVHSRIDGAREYASALAEIERLIELSVRRTREEDALLEHLLELAEEYCRRRGR